MTSSRQRGRRDDTHDTTSRSRTRAEPSILLRPLSLANAAANDAIRHGAETVRIAVSDPGVSRWPARHHYRSMKTTRAYSPMPIAQAKTIPPARSKLMNSEYSRCTSRAARGARNTPDDRPDRRERRPTARREHDRRAFGRAACEHTASARVDEQFEGRGSTVVRRGPFDHDREKHVQRRSSPSRLRVHRTVLNIGAKSGSDRLAATANA